MYTLSDEDRELLLAQGIEPDDWEEEFARCGGHDRRTYDPYEEPPSQTMLWTVLGTAVGVLLGMLPCFRRQRRGTNCSAWGLRSGP